MNVRKSSRTFWLLLCHQFLNTRVSMNIVIVRDVRVCVTLRNQAASGAPSLSSALQTFSTDCEVNLVQSTTWGKVCWVCMSKLRRHISSSYKADVTTELLLLAIHLFQHKPGSRSKKTAYTCSKLCGSTLCCKSEGRGFDSR
jgi:hypothetical protein